MNLINKFSSQVLNIIITREVDEVEQCKGVCVGESDKGRRNT